MPLLTSDLYEVMLACVNGNLNKTTVQWSSTKFAVGVVVVSGGYPGSYPKGKVITGLFMCFTLCLVDFLGFKNFWEYHILSKIKLYFWK